MIDETFPSVSAILWNDSALDCLLGHITPRHLPCWSPPDGPPYIIYLTVCQAEWFSSNPPLPFSLLPPAPRASAHIAQDGVNREVCRGDLVFPSVHRPGSLRRHAWSGLRQ